MSAAKSRKRAAWQAAVNRRFFRNIAWLCLVGTMLVAGQAIRFWHLNSQSDRLGSGLEEQYQSVLGDDIGSEPFGRLQFEAGKLQAERKVGLDPLGVMASLSRNDTIGLRIFTITLSGMEGTISGEIVPDRQALDAFMKRLSEEDAYSFTLASATPIAGGVRFTLEVGRL